jgi:hypothetical protein
MHAQRPLACGDGFEITMARNAMNRSGNLWVGAGVPLLERAVLDKPVAVLETAVTSRCTHGHRRQPWRQKEAKSLTILNRAASKTGEGSCTCQRRCSTICRHK